MAKYTARDMRELADSNEFAAYLYDDPNRCPDPDFAEDDITRTVKDMLRQAADAMEREKKYQYAVRFNESQNLHAQSSDYSYVKSKADRINASGFTTCHIVRREVGEWEEVK